MTPEPGHSSTHPPAHDHAHGGPPPRPPRARPLEALRHRNFRLLWSGAVVSNIGGWMQNVAVGVVMFELTQSPAWVGYVTWANLVPFTFFSLLAGLLADRFDRRRILLVTQTWLLGWAATLGLVTLAGGLNRWNLLALAFAIGSGTAFAAPPWHALLPDLVPREHLFAAIALNTAQFNLARVIGPMLGGFVIAVAGAGAAFLANAASFIAVIGALLMLRIPDRARPTSEGFVARLRGGIGYARRHLGIRVCLGSIATISLVGAPVVGHMPDLAAALGRAGEVPTAILVSAVGTGAVAGSLLVAVFGERIGRPRLVVAGITLLGTAELAGLVIGRFWVMVVCLVLYGAGYFGASSALATSLQLMIPDEMRGRLISLFTICFGGVVPFGALWSGVLGEITGIRVALGLGAALVLAYAATLAIQARWRASLASHVHARYFEAILAARQAEATLASLRVE